MTQPYSVEIGSLLPDSRVYGDRGYAFVPPIPDELRGMSVIRTINDDKPSTSSETFLSFDVNLPVRVYVALDSRIVPAPAWLDSWTKTSLTLTTTDPNPQRVLYMREFAAGRVDLGANHSPATPQHYSMYSVLLKPLVTAVRQWMLYE
jgi:pectinesterase